MTEESDKPSEQNEEQTAQETTPVVDEKEVQIEELKAKLEETNDKYLRLYSEFDNFRKRTAKEKVELMQTAGEDVFKSILPVLDDFERAIKSNTETTDVKAVTDGVQLIFNKFQSTLTHKGLSEMKTVG
ncbi:MAG: nucleotide exchange factor GrpE, partial [Bacteroidetes bacterium]|nr:nucleotide exchange factor GrpE [Bacteroidota bacterium]